MIEAASRIAAIAFDGRAVTITRTRSGYVGKGTQTIPISQISAIRWKPAGSWSGAGHIKFVLAGTVARTYDRTKVFKTDVLKDENAVPFSRKQQPDFEKLRAAVEQAIAQLQGGAAQPAGGSLADELVKLQSLVQAGALSQAEFEQAKGRLLG